MKLLEYQGKSLLKGFNINIPRSVSVAPGSDIMSIIKDSGITQGVAKAQAFTGGRGKAGGIRAFSSASQALEHCQSLLGSILKTHQSGTGGALVHAVLLEEKCDIQQEIYLSILMDRGGACPVAVMCAQGGVEIEETARIKPEQILKQHLPVKGPVPADACRQGAQFLGLAKVLYQQWEVLINKLHKAFLESDCSLLEINPLVITRGGDFMALDCKADIDDNALFRQKSLPDNRHLEWTKAESQAADFGLNYIQLEGNIGCMVNGAGLAMATMDIIKTCGGQPANFLDVGGSASEEAITQAFKIITGDPQVKGILVNIFGGIMKCNIIARGIVQAVKATSLKVPLVVRLSGTNFEEGRAIINSSGLELISAHTLIEAAEQVVSAVNEGGQNNVHSG